MPTVKLVVIGASGVGKTSLRGQYITGRFSNGYRATIGADFITKTLPHPTNPDESITLQIWDTAGQERFSSLSTAFFRGADAALLMFDVNAPHTMEALKKWWAEFRERAPLADEDMEDYCCVVVGNKIDMPGSGNIVTEAEASRFLEELVPPSTRSPSPVSSTSQDPDATSQLTERPFDIPTSTRSDSIAIVPSASYSPKHQLSKSRSRSSSRFYSGTMTTTVTIYHTPSSSLFDVYQSARSSPEPWSRSTSSTSLSPAIRERRMTTLSTGSTSTGSVATITPSLFAREHDSTNTTTPNDTPLRGVLPPPPAQGPKLFFTSAKTGEGVADVFEYIARRVVRRWEYQERIESRRMFMREASDDTVRLGLDNGLRNRARRSRCCAS